MNILAWIILGALAGWIASIIMRTNQEQGLLMDMLVGILGALIGGFIMGQFNQPQISGFNLYSLFVAILGAMILLAIVKLVEASGSGRSRVSKI